MKPELYDDVMEEEPSTDADKKEQKKFDKRLRKSIGWLEPEYDYAIKCDEKGKTWEGAEITEKIVWEVSSGEGGGITVDDEIQARMLALLLQINERLKRIEVK